MTDAVTLDQVRRLQDARSFPVPREEGASERELDTGSSSATDADLWPGWPCGIGEEMHFSKCYQTCANMTENRFPFRASPCKCCKSIDCLKSNSAAAVNDCARFNVGATGLSAHRPYLPDCPYENEELFEGLCFYKCSLLTMGKYSLRTGVNTCSGDRYMSNWTMGLGMCNGFGIGGTKCMPHIPKAAKQAFSQPGHTPGQAPMGWTNWPKLNKDNVKMVHGMIKSAAQQEGLTH